MGRKSRLKWIHRQLPLPRFTLETRWGTSVRARAFGGAMEGMRNGALLAIVLATIGLARFALGGTDASAESPAEILWYVVGAAAGGAAAGSLAPFRHRRGMRTVQSLLFTAMFMFGIMRLAMGTFRFPPEGWIAWGAMTLLYALVLRRTFADLVMSPAPDEGPRVVRRPRKDRRGPRPLSRGS